MKKLLLLLLFALFLAISCKKTSSVPTTFKITSSVDGGGTISPFGTTVVKAGVDQTYSFTSSDGNAISSISVDGAPRPIANSFTFTAVEDNHTITVAFGIVIKSIAGANGTATPTATTVHSGGSVSVTFAPNPGFHTDSLWLDGTFVKVLAGVTTYTITNVIATHTVRVSFSDALSKSGLDSLNNLLIGEWILTSHQSKLGKPQNTNFNWDAQDQYPCSPNQYDEFYANGVYKRNNNGTLCNPLAYEQFSVKTPNHWTLKTNGKTIYLDGAPRDSLTNVTIKKDSLITYYSPAGIDYGRISYWYHYARK